MSLWAITSAAAAKSLQSCTTLQPHRRQPTRLSRPWDSPGRTLEWVAISFSNDESEKWKWSRSVVSDSLWPHGLQPTRLLLPWDFPGKSTGVECHCLLRAITSVPSTTNEINWRINFFLTWHSVTLYYPFISLWWVYSLISSNLLLKLFHACTFANTVLSFECYTHTTSPI